MSAALLRTVLDECLRNGWLSLSPGNRDNQWCVGCRSLELLMRIQRRAYVMAVLQRMRDHDTTPPDIRLDLADLVDVL